MYYCNGAQYPKYCALHIYGESGANPIPPWWAWEMEYIYNYFMMMDFLLFFLYNKSSYDDASFW